MHRPHIRLSVLAAVFFLMASALLFQFYRILHNEEAITASAQQGKYKMEIPLSEGRIYDRHFTRLNGGAETFYAIVNPTPDAIASILDIVTDADALTEQIQHRTPFCCIVKESVSRSPNVQIFAGNAENTGSVPAQHLLGYRQNGEGVCGLERAFYEQLHSFDCIATADFTVDVNGSVLSGMERSISVSGISKGGVVTTLDKSIQQITEICLREADPNPAAAVVLDIKTGGVLAMASRPTYRVSQLAAAMEDDASPFLNRGLCAYSVGSVFKLATAAAALENGLNSLYMYECTGETAVNGQRFRCHHADGHGLLDMKTALVDSCNPYFIHLSQLVTPQAFREMAANLGFGEAIVLADGVSSAAGYLQTEAELQIDAEKANLSFGQGKLLASPLQIAAMTACIADNGFYHTPYLVQGITEDGETVAELPKTAGRRVLSANTAMSIQQMMCAVLKEGEKQNGLPTRTTAGGKTSTAQTGQFAPDGTEYCHAWMTGFFPAEAPQYAVTVFVERGGSGNQAAAPIFREIIDRIAVMCQTDT